MSGERFFTLTPIAWTVGGRLARTMTIEITHARTGRSMKKRASTAGLLSGLFGRGTDCQSVLPGAGGRGRHLHKLRLNHDARPDLLHAIDDDALARPQALHDLA